MMDDLYDVIDENVNPCARCPDYEAPHGCKSNGGCAKPVTNGDRIRAMTDEELADIICDRACMLCPLKTCDGRMEIGRDACYKRWLDWLKQEIPAEEVDNEHTD